MSIFNYSILSKILEDAKSNDNSNPFIVVEGFRIDVTYDGALLSLSADNVFDMTVELNHEDKTHVEKTVNIYDMEESDRLWTMVKILS